MKRDKDGHPDPDGPQALEWQRLQDKLWDRYCRGQLDAEEFITASLGLGPQPQDWAELTVARYMTHIHISAGHAMGSRPADWTTITIERAVDAPNRMIAYRAAEDYARELSPAIADLLDHTDTRMIIDTSLIPEGMRSYRFKRRGNAPGS